MINVIKIYKSKEDNFSPTNMVSGAGEVRVSACSSRFSTADGYSAMKDNIDQV